MQTKRTPLLGASIVLALTAAILAALALLKPYYAGSLAEHLARQLDQLPDDEVPVQLASIVKLGDAALPALCQSLASTKRVVADSAQSTLLEELTRWELLPPQQAGAKLARLAALLAQPGSRGREERYRRAELAERILAWPTAGLPQMPTILARCERVLEAANVADGEPQLLTDSRDARPLLASRPAASTAAVVASTADAATNDPAAQTADFVYEPPVTRHERGAAETMPAEAPPALLPADVQNAKPLAAAESPAAAVSAPQPSTSIRIVSPTQRPALSELNTIPLLQLLHSNDAAMGLAAREELARRGHAPLEIYLLEQLTDSDPRVRGKAAASLPAMPNIDARAWLMWLSRDESADVRMVALTLMATSGETEMLRRVKELAQSDPDANVRAQAQRVVGTLKN